MNKILESYLEQLQEEKKEKYIVELEITPRFKEEVLPMLYYIKKIAGIGHSFSVIVDPDSKEYTKRFGVDGDGSSHIKNIKLNDEEYENDITWNK